MDTIAKLTITRSGYLIELTELGKHLSPGTYELTQVPVQQADRQRVPDAKAIAECLAVLRPIAKGKFPQEQALEELAVYLADAPEAPAPHPDDVAVDDFAQAMKYKLASARHKGREGWQTFPPEELSRMLREHVEKGDPLDVANFCMFLWWLGHGIAPAQASAVDELEELRLLCAEAYQVVGSLLYDVGAFDDAHAQRVFNSTHAQKILDNLSQARRVHTDVLPWPTFTKPKD